MLVALYFYASSLRPSHIWWKDKETIFDKCTYIHSFSFHIYLKEKKRIQYDFFRNARDIFEILIEPSLPRRPLDHLLQGCDV